MHGEPTEAELNGETGKGRDETRRRKPATCPSLAGCGLRHSLDGRWRRRCPLGPTNRPGLESHRLVDWLGRFVASLGYYCGPYFFL